jgi:hypothetical protein
MVDQSRFASGMGLTAAPVSTAPSDVPGGCPPIARYRFHLTACDPIRLPAYAGSNRDPLLRGVTIPRQSRGL